jgi:glycosyltransferase involved in cell wall biosynthesis
MYLAHVGDRPSSITCHDLLAIRSAQGEFSGQRSRVSHSGKIQQRWIFKHLARARNVVCVSENTARELASLCGKTTPRITVIANALNPTYGSAASDESVAQARRRLGLATGERYLIHVGKDTWYKNRSGVLRIFQHLLERLGNGAPALRLVMAGQLLSNDLHDFVVRNLPERSMIEVANPSDEELRALYTGATGLLFPSLHEGFGWPLIEAQGCGCPVITSNRSPMSEVAGAAALYIDPADEPEAARLIAASLNGLEELREAGRQNAKRFDPATIISMYERFFVGLVPTRAS